MPILRRWFLCGVSLLTLAACNQLRDCVDAEVTNLTHCHQAKVAWCHCRDRYVDCQDHLWHFGAGFRQGYMDVLGGSQGCPPALPPRKYWAPCYQNPEGHCAIVAWFDGYQHGAATAMADGGSGGPMPTADELYRKNCRVPVAIDFDAFRASLSDREASEPAAMDGDVPPPVDDVVEEPTAPGDPYSPEVAPLAPDDGGPSAEFSGDDAELR